jgi:hypothetical protein
MRVWHNSIDSERAHEASRSTGPDSDSKTQHNTKLLSCRPSQNLGHGSLCQVARGPSRLGPVTPSRLSQNLPPSLSLPLPCPCPRPSPRACPCPCPCNCNCICPCPSLLSLSANTSSCPRLPFPQALPVRLPIRTSVLYVHLFHFVRALASQAVTHLEPPARGSPP